ncbi:hypothetical protein CISG_07271 [Coccidioides immitis RMSCC 3703]|uniref:UDP-glucose:glycoprotein glucosyltransferase n=1 Tax=Coccidioides immitis RMSCC 3703 TaxID=454286 RepID=A0A0J8R400_COCIT|nr:hypothetical protein CISG_07271 [Coccidioides immitis RMSCC 3703]
MLVSQLQMFITRKIPIRFGMVPTLPDEASMQQIRVASYLHQTYGLKTLLTYFENALEGAKSQIVWPSKDSFNAAVQDREHHADRPKLTFEEILSSDHFEPTIITKTKAYLKRLSSDGPNPPMFVNGAIIPRDEHWMQPLVTRLAQDLEEIQQAIYGGLYDDDSWLPIHFLDGAVLTRNPLIIPEDPGAIQIRDLHAAFKSRRSAFDALPRIRASSDSNLENWSSLILIADFDSEDGIKQLGSVLEFREKNPGIEVLLLHDSHLDFSGRVSAELFNLMKESRDVDVSALKSILEVGSERLLTQEPDVERRRNYFSSFSPLARELGSNQGGVDIVFNGRLIGPIPSSSLFGYWKKFLKGLPYHISALYVVDLNRFRELAAGDRLRGQYQSLSADPNSLANLDQDLPNHMQHAIPIKSLSQDWLWCETWCSDEALKTARTIDLCNNPMTKEPKLERARRQVPEWTEYDDEIAELGRRVAREQGQAGDEKNEKMRERDEL